MSRDRIAVVVGAFALFLATPVLGVNTPGKVAPQREFAFTYSVTLPKLEGDGLSVVWLPLPLESQQQSIVDLIIGTEADHEIVKDKTYGNRLLKVSGSAKDLSGTSIDMQFTVKRQRITGPYKDGTDKVATVFTKPNALVPTDGLIAQRANEVAPGSGDAMVVARALYNDVVNSLSYDKSGDGWGRGDAIYACSVKKGNCTDFHSLFIGMCRSKGIPARFTIGFPLPNNQEAGSIGGYHCWAEFFVEGKGWIPVDASEANKHPEWTEFYFGNLDANRVEFTRGRDLVLPGAKGVAARNYFIYPLLVVDGVERDGLKNEFSFVDVNKDKKAANR